MCSSCRSCASCIVCALLCGRTYAYFSRGCAACFPAQRVVWWGRLVSVTAMVAAWPVVSSRMARSPRLWRGEGRCLVLNLPVGAGGGLPFPGGDKIPSNEVHVLPPNRRAVHLSKSPRRSLFPLTRRLGVDCLRRCAILHHACECSESKADSLGQHLQCALHRY